MRRTGAVLKVIAIGLLCLSFHGLAAGAESLSTVTDRLLQAVADNNMADVRELIDQGADPAASNEQGVSAVDLAVDKGFFEIAHFLIAAQKQTPPAPLVLQIPMIKNKAPAAAPSAAETAPASAVPSIPAQGQPAEPGLLDRLSRLFAPEKPAVETSSALDELEVFDSSKVGDVDKTEVNKPKQTASDVKTPPAQPTFSRVLIDEKPEPIPFVSPDGGPVTPTALPSAPTPALKAPVAPETEPAPVKEQTVRKIPTESVALPAPTSAAAIDASPVEPAKPQAPQQEVAQSDVPSILDRLADFFSPGKSPEPVVRETALDELEQFSEGTGASEKTAENAVPPTPRLAPEPAVAPQNAQAESGLPVEVGNNRFNPFTKLTDMILDLLPDVPHDTPVGDMEPQSVQTVSPQSPEDSSEELPKGTTQQEELAYEVEDLTVKGNPYKVALPPLPTIPGPSLQASVMPEPDPGPIDIAPGVVPKPEAAPRRNLSQADILFGGRGRIDQPFRQRHDSDLNCIMKKAWNSHFCVEDFQWPEEIQPAFGTPHHFRGGGQAIVHYKDGVTDQFHGLFPTESFETISDYFIEKLGSPTETPEIWTALLAEPKKRNHTYRWHSNDETGRPVVLEIREMDDLRWSAPPDKANGVIRLYRTGSETIFRLLTMADLLLMQVQNGSRQGAPDATRP